MSKDGRQTTAAIIAACNEAQTIGNVLRQLLRAGVKQVVIVDNGSEDSTSEKALAVHGMDVRIIKFHRALGHDVPRAIGAIAALRAWSKQDLAALLFIDGDWGGSFGPMLQAFIDEAQAVPEAIVGIDAGSLQHGPLAEAIRSAWLPVLDVASTCDKPIPCLLPQYVPRTVFQSVSPIWLGSPGAWFAATVQAGWVWRGFRGWNIGLVGNRSRSVSHNRRLAELIRLDARIAATHLGLQGDHISVLSTLPGREWSALIDYASSFCTGLKL
ncbi:hypothetical protein URH17368_0361 [Alicyclobacillus hesperidum URH17-3-68]|uniref:Glycosyltransferase 2-like domain-containing protein n=1 Tax=Alicyclobacillus hesperidum TaxID=89784 RepID=A0AA37U4F8_9BACL|nr:glycosyltransferase [Alicyclobacillus hesperidum]EJY56934.1 hypothetical protein URH17368_0361 [Alicyclobacillus hesperidum URH17-3-68]GLV13920.1 hypothetical protein Heshes_16040 [Alicyclobacillus hesperidum]